jgi:hypothetical protein
MTTNMHGSATKRLLSLSIVVLVATLLGFGSIATAQSVGTVSYQGLLKNSSGLINTPVDLDITYYYVETGAPIVTESFVGVPVTNGVFSVALGSRMGGLPAQLDLSKPIELGIRVNGSVELTPRAPMHAVPYALTSHSLDGILASATPANNRIFPLPVDANGHITYDVLPPFSINGLPSTDGNLNIAAGPNISVTKDLTHNRLLINGLGVSSVGVRDGIVGSNLNGVVTVGLDLGNILGDWLATGSVSGLKLAPNFAGEGVYIDPLGTLGLGVDRNQFDFVNNQLHLRTDASVIGTDGLLTNLQVEGSAIFNTNDGSMTVFMGPVYTLGGLDLQYQRITNLANPVRDDDAATASYVDQHVASASVLSGDMIGVTNDAYLNPASDGIGNRLIVALNNGTLTIDPARLSISGDATIDGEGVISVSHALVADFAGTFTGNLTGDVTGTQDATSVTRIQGVDINSTAPTNGQFLAFDGELNSWTPVSVTPGSGITSITAGTGIVVNNAVPAHPEVALQPDVLRGSMGQVVLYIVSGPDKDELLTTIINPNVKSTSVIVAGILDDSHMNANERYATWVSDVVNGSFVLHLSRADGSNMKGNVHEGAAMSYAIFN